MKTPIIKSNILTRKYNNEIYLKLEYIHPTGSHKDRETNQIIKDVISKKINKVGCASTGNAAISLAYHSFIYNLECNLWLTENIGKEKLALIKKFRPKIDFTNGDYSDAIKISNDYMKKNKIYNANPGQGDIRNNGDKEIGIEIANSINPNYIIAPVNNGTLFFGVWKGLNEKGLNPKMIGATSKKGKVASSIEGLHLHDKIKLDKIEDYELIDLNDKEIIHSFTELMKLGFFVEPASASTLEALKKLGIKNKSVCLILTASEIRFCDKMDFLQN
ncbi:pyridoxal-phosphate dependent enzyme [archaeon]|nr:pyridoxal-phosphate dependent enzyme [archaeon]